MADFSYGLFSNTRKFALNSDVSFNDFHDTLKTESSIDRADGSQLFITRTMDYFFCDDTKKKVSIRTGIVKDIIKTGFQRGVF